MKLYTSVRRPEILGQGHINLQIHTSMFMEANVVWMHLCIWFGVVHF